MTACTCNCLKNKKKSVPWFRFAFVKVEPVCRSNGNNSLRGITTAWLLMEFFFIFETLMMKLVLDPIVRKNENLLDAYRTT